MPNELTPAQKARKTYLEGIVSNRQFDMLQHLQAFNGDEGAVALRELGETGLYFPFTSFAAYVKHTFPNLYAGMSKSYFYRLVAAVEVIQNIKESPIGDSLPPPTNEAQCRELAKAPPAQQAEVWQAVVRDTEGKPTAKAIAEAVKPTPLQSFFGDTLDEGDPFEPSENTHVPAPTRQNASLVKDTALMSSAVPKKKTGQKWQASFIASTRFDEGNRRLINITNPFSGRTDKDIIDTHFDEDSGRQTTTDFYAVQKITGVPVLRDLYQIVLQAIDEGQHMKGLEALKNRIEMEQEASA